MNCPRCGGELAKGVVGRVCSPCGIVLPPASVVAAEILRPGAEAAEQFRRLDASVRDLARAGHWGELEALLLTPSFLEDLFLQSWNTLSRSIFIFEFISFVVISLCIIRINLLVFISNRLLNLLWHNLDKRQWTWFPRCLTYLLYNHWDEFAQASFSLFVILSFAHSISRE